MRRRRGRKQAAAKRVEDLLDQVSGRNDDQRDQRRESRWLGFRTLDLNRHRELFDRLVALDFDYLFAQRFAARPQVLADLLPQSVLGRAQNGHGWFTDEFGTALRFPDATFDRILTVLERGDPNLQGHRVRRRRGDMLRGFGTWLMERLTDPELELVGPDGPLFGIEFLAGGPVETRPFLIGLVLAGCMDDWSYRQATMYQHKRTFTGYPFHLGGGEILIVDRQKFELCGLGDPGATVFDDEQLRTLRHLGVLCSNRHADYSFPDHDQAFFRRQAGDGVCDDLALLWIGARHGYSALLGAFVMDAIDTYDKYLLKLTWGGYDGHLAARIQRWFSEREEQPLVDDREILDLIHFAAKRNDPPIPMSSSHRRLIQIEKHSPVPTLLNHWRFLQGEPLYDIKLGYSRLPASQFYDVAWRRFAACSIDVSEPRYIKWDRR